MLNNLTQSASVPSLVAQHIELFICPLCSAGFAIESESGHLKCSGCGRVFECIDGIPRMFWSNEWDRSKTDITDAMKSFYEETPFPNYEDVDSSASLREKAEKGVFARLLNNQMPYGAKILEVGCGTGQLSNFLGLTWGRTVFGADMCLNSLKLGHGFKEKN